MGRVREFDPQAPKGVLLSTLSWTARRRPVTWFLVNVGNKIDPYLMRATGGRLKTTVTAPTVAAHAYGCEERQEAHHPTRLLHRRR